MSSFNEHSFQQSLPDNMKAFSVFLSMLQFQISDFYLNKTVLTLSTNILSFINRGIFSEQKRLTCLAP